MGDIKAPHRVMRVVRGKIEGYNFQADQDRMSCEADPVNDSKEREALGAAGPGAYAGKPPGDSLIAVVTPTIARKNSQQSQRYTLFCCGIYVTGGIK